jgi:hypothetical protein|tara:strand:- start:2037 stop:2270 length:234 start_codon:yes stop_codon:yes gene_type:complete
MKLKLEPLQMEQVAVTYLDQLHHDLKEELTAHDNESYLDKDDVVDITRSVIAIEIIMKDLMDKDFYFQWKRENGVDL